MSVVSGMILMVLTVCIVLSYQSFTANKAELDKLDVPKGNKVYVDVMIKCQTSMMVLIASTFGVCLFLGLEPFTLPIIKFGGSFLLAWLAIYLFAKFLIVNKSIKTWN